MLMANGIVMRVIMIVAMTMLLFLTLLLLHVSLLRLLPLFVLS